MPQITVGRAEASATANFCASALQSGARALLTIVTTPNIPSVVAPQRKANHSWASYEACSLYCVASKRGKICEKAKPHPPSLICTMMDWGRMCNCEQMQVQDWINRSAMRGQHHCLSSFVLVR